MQHDFYEIKCSLRLQLQQRIEGSPETSFAIREANQTRLECASRAPQHIPFFLSHAHHTHDAYYNLPAHSKPAK